MRKIWVRIYEKFRPKYENLTLTMKEFMTQLLEEEQIDYLHPVQCRTKSILSFQEKLERKEYDDPLSEITDLTGLRVIVFYPDEISRVKNLIEENFRVDRKNTVDKKSQLAKNQFSYEGIHYVVRLPRGKTELSEYAEFAGLRFEIQLLTLCQYVWAEMQRKIEYKAEELIPPALSRKLSALMGMFETADTDFMSIRNEGLKTLLKFPLSRASLRHFLQISPTLKAGMRTMHQQGFTRMSSEEDAKYSNELLQACSVLGLEKVSSLKSLVSGNNQQKLMRSLRKHGKPSIRIGPTALSLMLVYHSNVKFSRKSLAKKGWKEPLLSILVDRS